MLLQHVMIWTCKSKILHGVTKKFYRECEPWAFAPSQRPRSDKFRVSAKWREEKYPISASWDYYNGFIQSRDCYTTKKWKVSFGPTLAK